MKRLLAIAAIAALAACSGNFSTGTSQPQSEPGIPPMNQTTPMPQTDANGLPIAPTPATSPGAAGTASYPLDDAQTGFACPQTTDGYACTLSLNLPEPTPTPSASPKSAKSAKTSKATPTPSPTPTPTATPSASPSPAASGSASASPSASPAPPTITLTAQASPKDAPKMVHIPANTLNTVPLMLVQLTTNADLPVDGWASAQFTLPKSEVDGRGFALQLFQVNKGKHHRVDYKAMWTLDKSTLKDTTLTFSFKPPKTKIAKGSTYALVLYGDEKTASASPSASASASPSPSPSATPAH